MARIPKGCLICNPISSQHMYFHESSMNREHSNVAVAIFSPVGPLQSSSQGAEWPEPFENPISRPLRSGVSGRLKAGVSAGESTCLIENSSGKWGFDPGIPCEILFVSILWVSHSVGCQFGPSMWLSCASRLDEQLSSPTLPVSVHVPASCPTFDPISFANCWH